MTTSRDAYIRLGDAADLLGVPRRLLIRRIGDGEIAGLRDPRDRRHTLVRRDDLERIMTPGGVAPTPARADQAVELAIV